MRIGIDLGGTKIEGLLLAPDGSEAARLRVATPQDDYDATVRAIAGVVSALSDRAPEPIARFGMGMPGSLSPKTGMVRNSNSVCLNGRDLPGDLGIATGLALRVANDANCFALSEASDGAGAGCISVFGIILGTGCGGGVVINGTIVEGRNRVGGEWGHNPLPAPDDDEQTGERCFCGRRGCLETFLSGPALARDHVDHGGEPLVPSEIAAAAAGGDAQAEATMRRYETRLAKALCVVMNIIDPDVIVLGGGLSNLDRLYRNVPGLWSPFVFSDSISTDLVPAVHGDSSGVRGAAWLWPEPDGR
ncbi:MAG: ROK family protein [Rhodospirillales bacterium]|nr:ROK family protein [Rhodospirillales bacterium]